MNNISNFFNVNKDFYGNVEPTLYDNYFINFIMSNNKQNICLLDVGGGAGTFAKLVKNNFLNVDVTIIDPSRKLLDEVNDTRIKIFQGALPNQIYLNTKYDYIHVKEVLHHITGNSIGNSKELLEESLFTIKDYLYDNGFVFIHELYYESYVVPSLSRNLIFYLLSMQNKLKIKVPVSEFLMGLSICFYTRSEFQNILHSCGFKIKDHHEIIWKDTWKKRLGFIKNWGRMLFILEISK